MCIDGRVGSAAFVSTAYETPSACLPVCCLPLHVICGATGIIVNEKRLRVCRGGGEGRGRGGYQPRTRSRWKALGLRDHSIGSSPIFVCATATSLKS